MLACVRLSPANILSVIIITVISPQNSSLIVVSIRRNAIGEAEKSVEGEEQDI